MKNWKSWRPVRVTVSMARIYGGKRLPRTAAALAYLMVLALFPGMICLYDLLALVLSNPGAVMGVLESLVLPQETSTLIGDFLTYVSGNANQTVFIVAFIAMLTSASAIFRTFSAIAEDISGGRRFGAIGGLVVSFVFALAFLLAVFLCILLILSGRHVLDLLDQVAPWLHIGKWWTWLRFVLLFAIILLILRMLYGLTVPRERVGYRWPGALVQIPDRVRLARVGYHPDGLV